MVNVAIIDKYKSKNDYSKFFDFDFDEFHLCDSNVKRVLKKDITLNTKNPNEEDFVDLDVYDYVILVGAEPCKHIANITSVVKYQGFLMDDKYLPLTNPSMYIFKPEGKDTFLKAIEDIKNYISGNTSENKEIDVNIYDTEETVTNFVNNLYNKYKLGQLIDLGVDTENSALYARKGYSLGICIATSITEGHYIVADFISDESEMKLEEIFNNTNCVFHNAKYDIAFLEYHYNFNFKSWDDTMLLHYCLNEQSGTHDLKSLCIKYTDLGDYDRELEEFKRAYCKEHKIRLSDFTYDLIPPNILGKYGATDPIGTLRLFYLFKPIVDKSKNLSKVYYNLLKPGVNFLRAVEDNGVPFDKEELLKAQKELQERIEKLKEELYSFEAVQIFEKRTSKIFNINSVYHVREVLIDILGLQHSGKLTDTGAISVDAEELQSLAEQHSLPELILNIKKATKIKSTYIDKVLLNLDADGRLRTNFNLTTTTSGRLSSSGTINMQQLPRDDKTVKRCIKARKGWKIVSQDLKTAEMYIVAALSGDKKLQKIFIEGGDYHSQMAKMKFNLPYTWQEIKEFHGDLRQAAKTVSFEILYKLNFSEEILQNFVQLKRWLKQQKEFIEANGYVYQFFGRKRRLPNAKSSNREVKAHEVRSGVNALVQGPASDVNLLAGIEMQNYIEEHNMKAKIFGLVHDSILAEVPDEELEEYTRVLAEITQKDRGLSIPNCPIGLDVEIGQDYSFKEAA